MAKTNTPKFGLPQWGLPTDTVLRSDFNEAFANIEDRAVKETRGTLASRPAFGNAGAYHLDTTTGIRYRDTGTAWVRDPVQAADITGRIATNNLPATINGSVINAGRVATAFGGREYTSGWRYIENIHSSFYTEYFAVRANDETLCFGGMVLALATVPANTDIVLGDIPSTAGFTVSYLFSPVQPDLKNFVVTAYNKTTGAFVATCKVWITSDQKIMFRSPVTFTAETRIQFPYFAPGPWAAVASA